MNKHYEALQIGFVDRKFLHDLKFLYNQPMGFCQIIKKEMCLECNKSFCFLIFLKQLWFTAVILIAFKFFKSKTSVAFLEYNFNYITILITHHFKVVTKLLLLFCQFFKAFIQGLLFIISKMLTANFSFKSILNSQNQRDCLVLSDTT